MKYQAQGSENGRLNLEELGRVQGGVYADGVFICTVQPTPGQMPGDPGFMYTLDSLG